MLVHNYKNMTNTLLWLGEAHLRFMSYFNHKLSFLNILLSNFWLMSVFYTFHIQVNEMADDNTIPSAALFFNKIQ